MKTVNDEQRNRLSGIFGSGDKAVDVAVFIIATLMVMIVLYPLIYVVSCSFSAPSEVLKGKVFFLPIRPTLMSYQKVLSDGTLNIGVRNSIFYTIVGTAMNLLFTTTGAYALSEKNLVGRSLISKLIVFTMMFSGGLIPTYMVVRKLGMTNTIWAITFPGVISVTNFMIMKNTFQNSIPEALKEAAHVEGASQIGIFIRIVLPLSMPIIAVMIMYYAVGHWNEYFNALIYLTDTDKQPLQVVLRRILVSNEINEMIVDANTINNSDRIALAEGIRYVIIVLSSIPMIIMYPFFQKFFTKGVMVGAVKG